MLIIFFSFQICTIGGQPISKLPESRHKLLPGWTGYNTLLKSDSDSPPALTKLEYLPVIDSSLTNMDTVYTILMRSIDIADALELGSIVLVMD